MAHSGEQCISEFWLLSKKEQVAHAPFGEQVVHAPFGGRLPSI
jgi:hypothetical protein